MDLEVGVLARIPADGEQTAGFFDERILLPKFRKVDWP